MDRILLAIAMVGTWLCLEAQDPAIKNFQEFEIEGTSCKVLSGIKTNLNSNYPSQISELRSTALERFNGTSRDRYLPPYLQSFDNTLARTKASHDRQELLAKTGGELIKYGVDVASSFAQQLPSSHIKRFAVPALKRSATLFVDAQVQGVIEENREEADALIKSRIQLLYTNGVDVTNLNDYQSFENLYGLAHADLPSMDREDFPVVNRELIKYAYHFMAQHREDLRSELETLDLRAENRYEDLRTEFNTRLESFNVAIKQETEQKFELIAESMATLTRNQFEVFETLQGIEGRVKTNERRIVEIEEQMVEVQGDVEALQVLQKEHGRLLAQNSHQVEILTQYAFQTLSTEDKIRGLDNHHFDRIYDETQREELRAELEEIQTKETIISVSNTIATYSGATYEFLVQTGVLEGEDAKRAGQLIHAIQLGTGVARMYAGDASGALSAMSGLGGLLGSGPQESAELQMLKYMMKEMNRRFDRIEQKLDVIEDRIEYLTEVTIQMYESMMKSFEVLRDKTDWIIYQNEVLRTATATLMYSDYNNCKPVKEAHEELNIEYSAYSDYQKYYTQETGICLSALNSFSISEGNFGYFHMNNVSIQSQERDYRDLEVQSRYKPTRDFFFSHFGNRLEKAANALMFPVLQTKSSYKPIFYLNQQQSDGEVDIPKALDAYYNYEMINQFADLFLTFSTYFEIADQSSNNFYPYDLENYLARDVASRALANRLLQTRVENLLVVTDYAIMQQSLIAGNSLLDPIYASLFVANQSPAELILAEEILTNNGLLARNFATFLINKNLYAADVPQFNELMESPLENVTDLNELMRLKNFNFVVEGEELWMTIRVQNKEIRMLAPTASAVAMNQMQQTGALYALLETRQRLYNELVDLGFLNNLDTEQVSSEDYKYFFMEEDRMLLSNE